MDENERARLAREVVELGEELFELALHGYTQQKDGEALRLAGDAADVHEAAALAPTRQEAYPVEEVREAAGVFFRVLRGLLAVEE